MNTFLDKVEKMLEEHRKYLTQSFIYNDTDKGHLDKVLSWLKTDLLTTVAEHFGEVVEKGNNGHVVSYKSLGESRSHIGAGLMIEQVIYSDKTVATGRSPLPTKSPEDHTSEIPTLDNNGV